MSRKSALVVDDSKSARFALTRCLEQFEYEVLAAASGTEAIDVLGTHRPDVIFLDHLMPGMDGFGVLDKLKGDTRLSVIPVVMCSSRDGYEFLAESHERGAFDVLHKPLRTEQLARVLSELKTARPIDPETEEAMAGRVARAAKEKAAGAARPSADPSLQQVSDRLAQLEAQLMVPPSLASGAATPTTPLAARVALVDERIGALDEQVVLMVSQLDERMGQISRQLEAFSAGNGDFQAAASDAQFEGKASALDARIAGIEQQFGAVEARLGKLTSMLSDLKTYVDAQLRSHGEAQIRQMAASREAARQAAIEAAKDVAERTAKSMAIYAPESEAFMGSFI